MKFSQKENFQILSNAPLNTLIYPSIQDIQHKQRAAQFVVPQQSIRIIIRLWLSSKCLPMANCWFCPTANTNFVEDFKGFKSSY